MSLEPVSYTHLDVYKRQREGTTRAVADYIAGMTDSYAMAKYGELFLPAAWTVK